MKKIRLIITVTFMSSIMISCNENVNPPVAKKVEKELTIHGDTRIDNYYWMNERDHPDVVAYLESENEYTEHILEPTEALQEKLFNEMKSRMKEDDSSVPYFKNGYYYYRRYDEGMEYPLYCRKKGSLEADEEIMLNVNEMAKGFNFYSLVGVSVSPDNKMVAFGVDTLSRRKYTLYIKDLESGEILKDAIPVTTGSSVWANDNKTIFYTRKDEITLRSDKIYRHQLGDTNENDQLVFFEEDETYSVFVRKSKSDKYIFIGSNSTMADEYHYLDASKPSGEFKVIQPRERGLEYSIAHFGNHFFIKTNLNATNFKLMKTPVKRTEKENWEDVIPHREDVFLQQVEIFNKFLVLEERNKGINQLRIISWNGEKDYYIPFEEETYSVGISYNPDFNSEDLRYSYTSLTIPRSIYDFDMVSRERELLKQDEVLGDFDPDNYESKRLWATADDSTQIPMSIVYKKGIELNGSNPTLLYGYGSYGATMDPYFSSVRLSLLDRGFVFAIAHIRGSQYLGRPWYEDGKLLNKINTFSDFNDCAEHLIKLDYTSPEHLYAMGGSAGGLLMGAIINMQPELYHGVIAAVPFVDVVTTMLDESIPLTTSEFDEWGNPKEKEYYDYMLSYSPYDQVKKQDYPNLLVTTGYYDSQVQYWEPAKWVAKLRQLKTDENLLILHTNMEAGHGGASGRFKRLKETAMEYAFILYLENISE